MNEIHEILEGVYKNGQSNSDLDITNYEKVLQIIKDIKPRYLVHAAAISDTGLCERNPKLSYEVNVEGSVNLAKACERVGAKNIYLSSDQVYNGNEENGPYNETDIPIPNTVYGMHKLQAENKILEIVDEAVIIRLTWLYSFPERNKKLNANIISNVIKGVLVNRPISLRVNEYRGITYVYDLINNFDRIMELPKGVYNVGSENDLSTYEVGKVVLKEMGIESRSCELLHEDKDAFRGKNRNLRIYNTKRRQYKIYFEDTEESISKCVKEFTM
ncbi:MAG: sugar nucleotide-binding protein [Clostridium sp.]|uniref:SDR family oxidoreductase n=1 Tax=Clostridium sp. TaxID=1506 RepID=UPI003027A63C